MNYSSWVTSVSTLTAIPSTNAPFAAILPDASTYATNRISRELDLMSSNVRDATSSTVASNRNFNLPTGLGTFLVIDGINVITPAATAPDSGTRNPLVPVSRDFLDLTWPSTTGGALPQYFSYLSQDTQSSPTQTQVIFGPWPDAIYRVEVIGKIQPSPLSATTTQTWIGDNLPELFLAASMVFITGYLRNYGSQADDPKQAMSWEQQYQILKASADVYEARKRFSGASWSPKQIEPVAQPQRG